MSVPCASADVATAEWWEYDPFHVALDKAKDEETVRKVCVGAGLDSDGIERVVRCWQLTRAPLNQLIINRSQPRPSRKRHAWQT